MLESALTKSERHTWFGRAEVVGKLAHDLHAHEFTTRIFIVGKIEAGYVRHFQPLKQMVPGVGAVVSADLVPRELGPRYSGRVPPGFGVFLILKPSRKMM